MSHGPYSLFDWPHAINVLETTRGKRDGSGNFTLPSPVAGTAITGNFQTNLTEDNASELGGEVPEGSAILFTEATIPNEARVSVSFDATDTVVRTYLVAKLLRQYSVHAKILGGAVRYKYHLVLESGVK